MKNALTLFIISCGLVSSFAQEPFTVEALYKGDFGTNHLGGFKQGSVYMGLMDLGIHFNTEQAGLWKGGEVYIQIQNTHGGNLSGSFIGDLQVASNIENAPYTYLYMAWYKQEIGKLMLLGGIHDFNSEFSFSDLSGVFLNSSFGIMPNISLNVPVSIFPKNALGLMLHYSITDKLHFQSAIYDGDPGTLDDLSGNTVHRLNKDEGALIIGEMHYLNDYFMVKTGFYYHTSSFQSFSDPVKHYKGNEGVYFLADYHLNKEDSEKGVGVFLQGGVSNAKKNTVPLFIGAGVNYGQLLFKNKLDVLSLAFGNASLSNFLIDDNVFSASNEAIVELNYLLPITDGIFLQPDVQYIINPGANGQKNALVSILRFTLEW